MNSHVYYKSFLTQTRLRLYTRPLHTYIWPKTNEEYKKHIEACSEVCVTGPGVIFCGPAGKDTPKSGFLADPMSLR
jgi:hypothetical protein